MRALNCAMRDWGCPRHELELNLTDAEDGDELRSEMSAEYKKIEAESWLRKILTTKN